MANYYLFEYGKSQNYGSPKDVNNLEALLFDIWQKRKSSPLHWLNMENVVSKEQGFLQIDRNNQIRANNYIGLVKHENNYLHLLPKIFYQANYVYDEASAKHIFQHLLWWMRYCHKIQLPFALAGFDEQKGEDMVEVLLYFFAHYTYQLLQKRAYYAYQDQQNNTAYIKGRLNMSVFTGQHLAKAKWQSFPCVYTSFEKDNLLNRIVKFTARQLLYISKRKDTQGLLEGIIENLFDVKDVPIVLEDCDKVRLNPLFSEWQMSLNYCRMFLSNSTLLAAKGSLAVFAFLIPMEQLFEEFVFGFLQEFFPQWNPQFQEANAYLAVDELGKNVFQMRHDITLEGKHRSFTIIDCKYKQIELKNGELKGIVQSDLYQMAAYAVRRGCKEVFLIYPKTVQNINALHSWENDHTYLDITDVFSGEIIRVWIVQMIIGILEVEGVEDDWKDLLEEKARRTLGNVFQHVKEGEQ